MFNETKQKMVMAIDHLKEEMKGVRTDRANPAMLDNVSVEVYGAQMRLRDISNITTPEPRQLLITPYDGSQAAAIGKSIEKANIGFTPIVDGNGVRINIPPMDASLRKEMVKILHRKLEECKVSIRNVRRDSNEQVKKQKGTGEIPEDEMKRLEKQIQDLTDKFCKEADDLVASKEKEVVAV